MLEIDRARGEVAKAAKREEQAQDTNKRLRDELHASGEARAQLEVRLDQARAETERVTREAVAAQAVHEKRLGEAGARETVLHGQLDSANQTSASLSAEVRLAHEAISSLRVQIAKIPRPAAGPGRR